MSKEDKKPKDPRILLEKLDLTDWRSKSKSDRLTKFTDEKKIAYLQRIFKHGKKTVAAYEVDIGYTTVQNHREEDLDFAALEESVLQLRAQSIVDRLEQEAIEGHDEPIVNKEGDVVAWRKRYETQLRAMVMKRYDGDYKDKSEIDMNLMGGGVLVAPAAMTPEEWVKGAKALKDKMQEDGMIENKDD